MLSKNFKIIYLYLFVNLLDVSFSKDNENDSGQLSIDRIFKNNEFSSKGFSARWSDDGKEFLYLKESEGEQKGKDIRSFNILTNKESILVKAELLIPSDNDNPLTIEGYVFSKDGAYLLIYTNSSVSGEEIPEEIIGSLIGDQESFEKLAVMLDHQVFNLPSFHLTPRRSLM